MQLTDEQRLVKLVADVISMHPCTRDYDHHQAHACETARAVIENLRRAGPMRLLSGPVGVAAQPTDEHERANQWAKQATQPVTDAIADLRAQLHVEQQKLAAPTIREGGLPHHVEATADGSHRCLPDCPSCAAQPTDPEATE